MDAAEPRTKVMMACSTLHIGGAESVAASLAQTIDTTRFELTVCYLKENGIVGDAIAAAGVELVPIPGFRPGGTDRTTSLKLLRLVRRKRIQVLHTHDVHGLIDATICRRLTPSLRHVHTLHFGNYPQRDRASALAERICWRSPDALVAVGHAQAEAIRKYYGIPIDRLRVIWNGAIDPDLDKARDLPPGVPAGNSPVILSVSTLIEQKGLPHLLAAARLLAERGQDFTLVLAGHGHLRSALEELAGSLGISDRVQFLGWVPDAAKRILPTCDVFVQSSLWEAMSVVVLEAMAAAKPVVVTHVGENPHVVLDGHSGLVVAPGDPEALADALAKLLRDPGYAIGLGRAARDRYLGLFTVRTMVDAYERLYEDLAGGTLIPMNNERLSGPRRPGTGSAARQAVCRPAERNQ